MLIPTCEIELTNRCNANCLMCPRDQLERPFGEMDIDTFKLVADKAAQYGTKNIALSGFGEPLLNARIADYIKYVKDHYPHINVNITTNAALLKRGLAEELALAGLNEIQISFNGWDKDSYEKLMRGLSFETVMKNLRDLKEITDKYGKPAIRFIPVLSKVMGKEQFHKMKSLLSGLGYGPESFIGYYICHNRCGYYTDPEVVDQEFYDKHNVKTHPIEQVLCRVPFLFNWVDWQGRAHLCCNDIKDKMILGDLKVLSFKDIEQKKVDLLYSQKVPEICRFCNLPFTMGERAGYVLKGKKYLK